MFLTLGIALGSWWAYYELGWGGWWFWDPVENASFMPWLVGTALIHSLAVTEKRGAFKSWTLLLALFAFSLSLLGTFLVRSGVLTSVHAFATDPERGMFILAFLCIVIGGSLALYAWRAPDVSTGGRFESISRESFLLANNLILVLLAILILIGTLAPLIFDALYGEKISVGFPWFNKMFLALTPFLAFFAGIGPIARWKAEQAEGWVRDAWWLVLGGGMVLSLSLAALAAADIVGEYWILIPFVAMVIAIAVTAWWKSSLMGRLPKKLAPAFALSVAAGGIGAIVAPEANLYVGVGLGLAVWILLSNITGLRERLINKRNFRAKLSDLTGHNRSYYGMVLAHLGVAMFIVGVTMVSNFGVEEDVRMSPGDEYDAAGFRFRFEGATVEPGPNYQAQKGRFIVFKDDKEITILEPEKRIYLATRQPMTEAAIDWGFTRDLYVSLGEPLGGGDWSLRVYYKPYVRWIWLGAVLMGLGGILAITDRRYRTARRAAKAPTGATARS